MLYIHAIYCFFYCSSISVWPIYLSFCFYQLIFTLFDFFWLLLVFCSYLLLLTGRVKIKEWNQRWLPFLASLFLLPATCCFQFLPSYFPLSASYTQVFVSGGSFSLLLASSCFMLYPSHHLATCCLCFFFSVSPSFMISTSGVSRFLFPTFRLLVFSYCAFRFILLLFPAS